jgi:phosphoribosyl-ATP pyrophosphohydrolase/phosphoribosyl-AMP cyclohydrolase/histidinol dehydrogenase
MPDGGGLRRLDPASIAWPVGASALPDVAAIVERVRADGDRALREFAATFGDPPPRVVPRAEQRVAYESLPANVRDALEGAAGRIRRFAQAQRAALVDVEIEACGMRVGHRAQPVRRVGAYVPAGRYPLPSTLLMCALPARVAGVERISVCTPRAVPETLAAAYIAGVDDLFEAGGPQAIAALAFGTEMIGAVDLIVGPGNAYVTAAKRAVYGVCGIDGLAGPSELIVIASRDADPVLVAADVLAQAEHDPSARVMLLADDVTFVCDVERAMRAQREGLATDAIASAALAGQGCAAVLPLDEAIDAANRLGPEHLHLHGRAAENLARRTTCYGALFVGSASCAAFGDYGAGPNHVLPTGGTARFASGLSALTFLRISTYASAAAGVDASLIEESATLAGCEGLDAHRASMLLRAAT